jgi:hypothetical protein
MKQTGPRLTVFRKYSEVVPSAKNLAQLYWELLRRVPQTGAVGVASAINNTLAVAARDRDAHDLLHNKFLRPEFREALNNPPVIPPSFVVVFSHFGCLMVLRDLLLFGCDVEEPELQTFGDLALLANGFLSNDPPPRDDMDLTISAVRTWDLNNQRDLAYSISRMFTILIDLLPSDDPVLINKRSEVALNPVTLDIGGLNLIDFVSVVFGLYAFANKKLEKRGEPVVFDRTKLLSNVQLPQHLLDAFLKERSLTLSEFKQRLMSSGRTGSHEDFEKQIANKDFLTTDLNRFREFPLIRIDENLVALLDLQFLVELLNSGVYWSIFNSLDSGKRESFKELWGRLFELYVVDLLNSVYPPSSKMLRPDVAFDEGQIDALIDCSAEVIVLEIKSSLLTEDAKRSGSRERFEADVTRKFIVNEKGKPKAIRQLARSSKALAEGKITTKANVKRIYPVLVSDEPSVEAFGFNTYLDRIFRQEVGEHALIKPLTVMHIQELEEFLAYAAGGKIGWSELLEVRFKRPMSVSVRQEVYDYRIQRSLPIRRNAWVLKRFESITKLIDARYGGK